MAKLSKKLTDVQRRFIVQRLACFDTPDEVATAVNEEFGLNVSRQAVHKYDPTKRAGQECAPKWKTLFEETRSNFLTHVDLHIPEANKAVRIRYYVHAARAFKGNRNYVGMKEMLEAVAKELGNVHSNKREIGGHGGGPIQFSDLTDEQLETRLAKMMATVGVDDTGGDEQAET